MENHKRVGHFVYTSNHSEELRCAPESDSILLYGGCRTGYKMKAKRRCYKPLISLNVESIRSLGNKMDKLRTQREYWECSVLCFHWDTRIFSNTRKLLSLTFRKGGWREMLEEWEEERWRDHTVCKQMVLSGTYYCEGASLFRKCWLTSILSADEILGCLCIHSTDNWHH